jgi:hypothetical protein
MSIERVFHCDGPECENHVKTAGDLPPTTFLVVTEDTGHSEHFCSWDCLLKFAATKPPTEAVLASDF